MICAVAEFVVDGDLFFGGIILAAFVSVI